MDTNKRSFILKLMICAMDLRSADIAQELGVSKSLISKYIAGEKKCPECDIYLIEKVFGIKVEEYSDL